jgi:hypothetical protein
MTGFGLAAAVAFHSASCASTRGECSSAEVMSYLSEKFILSRHGPHVDCMPESIALDYLALPPVSPSRAIMEHKFGKGRLVKLVSKYKEEQANKKWLADSTMACPGCRVHIEKSHGCNHVRYYCARRYVV